MIKLILFSCVTLTLINCSFTLESNDQSTNGNSQQLRSRILGNNLLSRLGTTSTGTSNDNPTSSSDKNGLDSLSKDGLSLQSIVKMTIGQIEQFLGKSEGVEGIKDVINYMKQLIDQPNNISQLLNGELSAGKVISKLISSTGSGSDSDSGSGSGSGSGSVLTKLISGISNSGSSLSSKGRQ